MAKRNIVFVHPDLGIGGAERLVIDAAVGLQSLGHKVTILTSYRDPKHCFEEARDGTLDVRVRGDAIFPPAIAGRLSILCTILRQLSLVASTGITSSELQELDPDVFIVDQLSACIPFFRLLYPKAKVLFYGHFPDQLLVKQEGGLRQQLKSLYRIPFDAFEGWSTGCADCIVVNSKFTRSVFKSTLPGVRSRELKVIYPCVDTSEAAVQPSSSPPLWPNKKLLLSINRFEGKKHLDLAIKAYAGLSPSDRANAILVLAGGYDPRNAENALTLRSLQSLASSLHLSHSTFSGNDFLSSSEQKEEEEEEEEEKEEKEKDVLFLLSIPSALKTSLLASARLLIYTPTNEHFGIVPLEAMLAGIPVLATNTGGPLETIYDGRTGWLRSPEKVAEWTAVMQKPMIRSSEATLKRMGEMGREQVVKRFGRTAMAEAFEGEVQRLVGSQEDQRPDVVSWWFVLVVLVAFVVAGLSVLLLWVGGERL